MDVAELISSRVVRGLTSLSYMYSTAATASGGFKLAGGHLDTCLTQTCEILTAISVTDFVVSSYWMVAVARVRLVHL